MAGAVILALIIAGCSPRTPVVIPTATAIGQLTPYHSPTPTETLLPPTPPARTNTPPPAPTATPFTYTVVKDDTLLGIALRFGISLDELLAANPGVDRRIISIGASLVIPIVESTPQELPTATPLALDWRPPVCYATADGGAWCFVWVNNPQDTAVENLSTMISLFSSQGELMASQEAIAPLNRLPAGQAIPLMTFFPGKLPENYSATADQVSGFAVPKRDERYLNTTLEVESQELEESRNQVTLRGEIWLPKKGPPPGLLWLVVVAYDREGNPAGLRRWEAKEPCGSPGGNDPLDTTVTPLPEAGTPHAQVSLTPARCVVPFELTVFSLGVEIERAEALVEARP